MSTFGAQFLAVLIALFHATAASAQTLKIDGSTGAMPLVAALAKAYEAKTPGAKIEIGSGLGTKARIEALKAGGIDIAVASHGLKTDELARDGMTVSEIARTPVVFGINASAMVTNLSQAQICEIYSGALTNWKAVNGPDLAIQPRTRPESEVDAEVVRDAIACLKTLKMPEAVKVMPRGGDMARELAATPGAIGMTTTTVAEQSGGKIKAVGARRHCSDRGERDSPENIGWFERSSLSPRRMPLPQPRHSSTLSKAAMARMSSRRMAQLPRLAIDA